MNITEFYYRVIDFPTWDGLRWAIYVAAGLVVLAAMLLVAGKLRWFARSMGLVALVLIFGVLYDIQGQSIRLMSFGGTYRHMPRNSPTVRIAARCGMVAVPAVALAIMVSAWGAGQQSMRSLVPNQLRSGRQHLRRKEYDLALREYNRALQAAPDVAEAYWGRGCVHQAKGSVASALADFTKAIESDSRFAGAYAERAKIRMELGDFDGALADFNQLMVLQASDPSLYLSRGTCFLKKGLYKDAAADFRRVLKLTNHSDFAEPAKAYLHQCESQTAPPALPGLNPNGWSSSTPVHKPASPDHIV
jgi:tetratricopeptide (TPR) repeat protein